MKPLELTSCAFMSFAETGVEVGDDQGRGAAGDGREQSRVPPRGGEPEEHRRVEAVHTVSARFKILNYIKKIFY